MAAGPKLASDPAHAGGGVTTGALRDTVGVGVGVGDGLPFCPLIFVDEVTVGVDVGVDVGVGVGVVTGVGVGVVTGSCECRDILANADDADAAIKAPITTEPNTRRIHASLALERRRISKNPHSVRQLTVYKS
jgi:hypothetical protein